MNVQSSDWKEFGLSYQFKTLFVCLENSEYYGNNVLLKYQTFGKIPDFVQRDHFNLWIY